MLGSARGGGGIRGRGQEFAGAPRKSRELRSDLRDKPRISRERPRNFREQPGVCGSHCKIAATTSRIAARGQDFAATLQSLRQEKGTSRKLERVRFRGLPTAPLVASFPCRFRKTQLRGGIINRPRS